MSNNSTKSSKTSLNSNLTPSPEENETIIGIDLGTTFSCVSVIRNDKVDVIADSKTGQRVIPSIVSFKGKDQLVGTAARNKMFQFPETTMYNSKRLIGRLFKDQSVQNDIKYLPVKIIEDPITKKPQYCIKVNNEEKKYFPEDVSSEILKYIKKYSEDYVGKPIKKAVITVPAYFNNTQREATKLAGEKAGLEILRIINEPTAAAIAYGDTIKDDKERKVLIFDLGGGTFDVSVLKIKGNEYYVLASCGDDHLGGEDFNELLVNYTIDEFKNENLQFKNIDFFDKNNTENAKALRRIREETESIKIELTTSSDAQYDIPALIKGKDLNLLIERTKFEELCKDKFEKCFISINKVLKLANLNKNEIDEIILVGGSSRIPKIQEMIKNYFNKEPLKTINQDEVVSWGAALVTSSNLKIFDITSKAIGIQTSKTKMEIIIPKGTILPSRTPSYFVKNFLCPSDCFNVIIKVLEGENEEINDKVKLLDKFEISLKKQEIKIIKIVMILDYNSILKVTGKIDDVKKNEVMIELKYNEDN